MYLHPEKDHSGIDFCFLRECKSLVYKSKLRYSISFLLFQNENIVHVFGEPLRKHQLERRMENTLILSSLDQAKLQRELIFLDLLCILHSHRKYNPMPI